MIKEIALSDSTKTREEFAQFVVKKCYFKPVGHKFEKQYRFDRDLRGCVQFLLTFEEGKGVYGALQMFEYARQGAILYADGKATRTFTDLMKYADLLKQAATLIADDLKDIEKFLKG